MRDKTILICLERLSNGGVETAVYNQSLALKNKGYNVVVLAKEGIYTKKLEEEGIVCIDIEFNVGNEIEIEKTKKIVEIIKKYNVGQVHIHQLPCILSAFPACLITNTPYVAFSHSRLTEVYDWYINTFSIYKRLLKFFFENAYKIITVNKGAIEANSKYFNIDKEKYQVLKNSIIFDQYVCDVEVNSIKNFMIIARIAPEKIVSIKNGIKFFIEYANTFESFDGKLAIYGNGTKEDFAEIQNYIDNNNKNKYNIFFAGETNEVAKEMNKYDVVIAMGRCMLEAIATKRLAILTSPNELKFLIDSTKMYDCIEAIFASNDLEANSLDNIIMQLKNLDKEKIKNLTEENYQIAFKELNMFTNVYYIEELKNYENYEMKIIELFDIQNEDLREQRDESLENYNNIANDVENLKNVTKEQNNKIEEQKTIIENKEKTNTELLKELNSVYNSKRFKLANNIANMLGKKGKQK